MRSQIATSNAGRGGRRYRPYVFTEHGIIMLANVINSLDAVAASIAITRAFIRMRQALQSQSELLSRVHELERRVDGHEVSIETVFEEIRRILAPPETPPRKIGFEPRPPT